MRQSEDGTIIYNTITTFRSGQKEFKIDVPFDDYTLDRRYTTTVATLDGNKLIYDQVGISYIITVFARIIRTFE